MFRRIGRALMALLLTSSLLVALGPAAQADPNVTGEGTTEVQRALQAEESGDVAPGYSLNSNVGPVGPDAAGAELLGYAILGDDLVGAAWVETPPAWATNAVVTNLGGYPVSGSLGALLTTGDSRWANQPNDYESSGRDSHGGIVRGQRTYDVSILRVDFDVPSTANCLNLSFRFYSEEYPEFSEEVQPAGRAYHDAFIAELDSSTWDTNGTAINAPRNFAHDGLGQPIGAGTSDVVRLTRKNAAGTTYDGATPTLVAHTPVTAGRHHVFLSIFDQYDAVYDSAVVVDGISMTHADNCFTGVQSPRRPIVFVPGILGSELSNNKGKVLWPDGSAILTDLAGNYLNALKLTDDGESDVCGCGVHPTAAIDNIVGFDIYGGALRKIQAAGYVLDRDGKPAKGESLFIFPVDWRRSAESNSAGLIAYIDRILQATGADRVNILAHSQGGLVSNDALSRPNSVGKVNRLVTFATPYLGAAKALGVLKYRKPCMIIGLAPYGCVPNSTKLSEVGTNMRGLLDLLPSSEYWDQVAPPLYIQRPGAPTMAVTYANMRYQFEDFNVPLIDASRAWHEGHDMFRPADPEVGIVRLVGSGYGTISSIVDKIVKRCVSTPGGTLCLDVASIAMRESNTGDGTVPKGSARGVNWSGDQAVTYYFDKRHHGNVKHLAIPRNDAALAYALDLVEVSGPLNTGSFADDPTTEAVTGAVAPAGVSDEPAPLTGTEVITNGPLAGMLTDEDGWRTGVTNPTTGDVAEDIPGSTFAATDEYSTTFLTEGKVTGRWTATQTGEVRLHLRGYTDDAITSAIPYPPVSVAQGAVLTLGAVNSSLGSTGPDLKIDDNADGTVDRTIAARPVLTGTVAGDQTEPTSALSITRYTASNGTARVKITVTATDEAGGSGVDRIEWLQTSESTFAFHTYTGVLDLPATGMFYARAIDRAGNVDLYYSSVNLAG